MQSYKYILLLDMYFKEYTDLIKNEIKCSSGNGWDGIEQLRWQAFSKQQQQQQQTKQNRTNPQTKSRMKQVFSLTSEGAKRAWNPKQLTINIYLLASVYSVTSVLSVAYECCVGISDSANAGFLPWVLRVCATKAPLKLNMEWVAGLWWASSTEDGFTVGQQQDFKWLLNRDEYFLASFPLLPRTVIEYLCHPFVLSQEPDPPRVLRRKTFYF